MSLGNVLIFCRYYLPGYKAGGPIRSIKNLVNLIGDDIIIKIITSDRDFKDNSPFSNIVFNTWIDLKENNFQIFYVKKKFELKTFINPIRKADTLYLNSFFDPIYSILPMLIGLFFNKKVVVAPRGEFSEGALLLKFFKKKFYLNLFKFFKLKNKIYWHFTNDKEHASFKKVFGGIKNYHIAGNISFTPNQNLKLNNKKKFLDLFYLGRIAEKKNIKFALEILSMVSFPVRYSIYGPIDDNIYWLSCKKIIKSLPSHVQVDYKGHIKHTEIKKIIISHEVMFFPTLGENFGHCIAESLSQGIPVITSDQTPWTNLYKNSAGWNIQLENKNQFLEAINELYKMSKKDFFDFRLKTLKYYEKKHLIENDGLKFKYMSMLKSKYA